MKRLQIIKFMRAVLFLLSLTLFFSTQQPTHAQENPTIEMSVKAGFDGYYKSEYWVPVQVTIANNGPNIEGFLQVIVGDGTFEETLTYRTPISLPTQSNKRVPIYVKLSSSQARALDVTLVDDDGRIVTSAQSNDLTLSSRDQVLYTVVSDFPGEMDFLEDVTGSLAKAKVGYLDVDDIPTSAPALNSINVLVFDDVDSGELSTEQLATIESWVNGGGQLVVTGGASWQKTTTAFRDWLPVTVSGSESVDDLSALSDAIGEPFRDTAPYLIATSSLKSGELIYHQAGLPILASQPMGTGTVYFLALDPKLAPLDAWDGTNTLFEKVAEQVHVPNIWELGPQNSVPASRAINIISDLVLPSAPALILFLLLYIIIVGPVNYLVLRRRKKAEWAWATIPLLVFLFTLTAYLVGFQLKGNDVILNQMSVVYGDLGTEQQGRVHTILGLYSPRRATYNLSVPANTLLQPFEQSFSDSSGVGNLEAVSYGAETTAEDVLVDVSGTAVFRTDSYAPLPDLIGQLTLVVRDSGNELQVNIQNNSDLDFSNATLLIGDNAYTLGDLPAGEPYDDSISLSQYTLSNSTYYGGITNPIVNNSETIAGGYAYSDDLPIIARHELLESLNPGYGLPTLATSQPRATDQSNLATLIAWSDAPQITPTLDKRFETRATTLYLIKLPIDREIVQAEAVEISSELMTWQVLDSTNVYDPRIRNLYLSGGTIEFAYTPWADFASMIVESLEIQVEVAEYAKASFSLRLSVWNWQSEEWDVLNDEHSWSLDLSTSNTEQVTLVVNDPDQYMGPNNEVRLKLSDRSSYGSTEIQYIHPVIKGKVN